MSRILEALRQIESKRMPSPAPATPPLRNKPLNDDLRLTSASSVESRFSPSNPPPLARVALPVSGFVTDALQPSLPEKIVTLPPVAFVGTARDFTSNDQFVGQF